MERNLIAEIAMATVARWAEWELPIAIYPLCQRMGIGLKLYDPKDNNDGYSTILLWRPYIFVSSQSKLERQRFTAAHELGHILLGHVGEWITADGIHIKGNRNRDIEWEANAFAAELLMPSRVLIALGVNTVEEIMRLCDVGYSTARRRLKELRRRRKNSTPFSRTEQFVCFLFADYIERMKKQ